MYEPLVKNPAIDRKNHLLVGRERGSRDAEVFYSLVSSATANGVEPVASEDLDAVAAGWSASGLDDSCSMDTFFRRDAEHFLC